MVKCLIALKPFVHNPKERAWVIMIEKYCDTCSKMIAHHT